MNGSRLYLVRASSSLRKSQIAALRSWLRGLDRDLMEAEFRLGTLTPEQYAGLVITRADAMIAQLEIVKQTIREQLAEEK